MHISALILAAGRSTRMGQTNKLLADWHGEPMIRHIIKVATQSKANSVTVVTGFEGDKITAAIPDDDIILVDNPHFSKGLSTSLKAGIKSLPNAVDAAIICLGDMPYVEPGTLNQLIAAFDPSTNRHICVPTYKGKRGNPVLWGRSLFPEILKTMGDEGAKHVMNANPDNIVEVSVGNSSIHTDIDTIEDLKSQDGAARSHNQE